MQRTLIACAYHSRLLLISGLLAGIGLPGLAAAMAPYLPEMVVVLLVITAFRIGAKPAFGALGDLRWTVPAVLMLQVGLPLLLVGGFGFAGLLDSPFALACVLATAAPTLTGGASLAIMLRQSPARMMQLLVIGTALFPVTVLMVLSVVPVVGSTAALVAVGVRSSLTIVAAAGVGFALRRVLLPRPTPDQVRAMDGAAILFFAIIVIGLMAALGPVLSAAPVTALMWLVTAFALSFGLQALTLIVLARGALAPVAGPLALAAGNRNIALFLIALPPETIGPILIFVACWQVPMYLTPVLLPRLYAMVPAYE